MDKFLVVAVVLFLTHVSVAATENNLEVTGPAPAVLTIDGGLAYNFGNVTPGAVNSHPFTVTNVGNSSANLMSGGNLPAPFQYKGGTYPGTGGTCLAWLAQSASCTVVVSFAPTVTGAWSANLSLNYNNGREMQIASRNIVGQSKIAGRFSDSLD